MQNTDITSQLSTYTITPSIHNHVVAHIQIITIHTRYFHIIITVDRKIGISDAGTPQPDRDLNVETLLVKL